MTSPPDLTNLLPFLKALKKADPGWVSPSEADESAPGASGGPADFADTADMTQASGSAQPPAGTNLPDTPTDMSSQNADAKQGHPTRDFLLGLLKSGLVSFGNAYGAEERAVAASGGKTSAGAGVGFLGAQEIPIEQGLKQQQLTRWGIDNAIAGNQLLNLPFLNALTFKGKQAEIAKTQAETGKATAETTAIPIKSQIEQLQANAAQWKEEPGTGLLRNVSTGATLGGSDQQQGYAPLTQQEADILGKQAGDRVPIKIKNQANEMANRGIRSVSAGGRQLLVDNEGNTIKDMGPATPMTVLNAQMTAPAQVTPEMSEAAGRVAAGKIDLATALAPFRRFPGQSEAFMNEVFRQNPDYNQATYGVSKKTMDYFTTGAGANELTAFRTAIAHADLLMQAAQALNNNDSRTLSGIQNRLETEFGDPRLTTFQAIANAYNHEVTSAISKGHITDKEVSAGDATMPSDANLETIQSVANAYKGLMASKAQQRMIQYEQGLKGQAAFPAGISAGSSSTSTSTPAVTHRYNPQTGMIEPK